MPGGRADLPHLVGPTRSGLPRRQPVVFVKGGFAPPEDRTDDAEPVRATFRDYHTTESLFYGHDDDRVTPPPPGPHEVLGVDPGASWDEIRAAHRALMIQLHPDRYVTADPADRDRATMLLNEVNDAFAVLSAEHRRRR